MRLYKLTLATIFQRKAWALCYFAVLVIPFVLPLISSATEKPTLTQPARVLAAWSTLWICGLIWGLFAAAREGENNAKSGLGEYFLTTGLSPTRQLIQIWLSVATFVVPLSLITALFCQFAALPTAPDEQKMWWVLNAQHACLFSLVISALLMLSTAIASRFGGITGFSVTLLLALYGLYGVGYLDNMLAVEENPVLQTLLLVSPQYRWADLTQRATIKFGALPASAFWTTAIYFLSIFVVYAGVSRLCFRIKTKV